MGSSGLEDRAFDALAAGDVGALAATLDDARSGGRAAIVLSTLLCRADLSPGRLEPLLRRCRRTIEALARAEVAVPAHSAEEGAVFARRFQLGLLHDAAELVLRACAPKWPEDVAPDAVASALALVVAS